MKIVLFQIIQFSTITQFLFQAIQLSQTVLIQLIPFSISTDIVYTQSNVKTFEMINVMLVLKAENL